MDKLIAFADRMKQFVLSRRRLPKTVTRRMQGGYSVILHPRKDKWERRVYWQRTYEPATLALIDACLRPGDRMVDIGANIGLMTLHASRSVGDTGSVIALEPHPATFARLQDHIQLNRCKNVTALNVAAGPSDGTLELFDTPARQSGQASLIAHSDKSISAGRVDVRRMDDILPASTARTFVKIDVEGFEHQVLLGAPKTLQAEPVICMECDPGLNPDKAEALSALRLIMATGLFGCYRFAESKFLPSPRLIPADEDYWLTVRYENAIFIPHSLREELAPRLLL